MWQPLTNTKKYQDKRVFIGSVTDLYLPEEAEYVPAIIDAAKDRCNLVWLEYLNLRGGYKSEILSYIADRYPELVLLCDQIYRTGDRPLS